MDGERVLERGVRETLRDATRAQHATLSSSAAMVRLFDAGYSVSEYRAHLGRLLGFFEPLERLMIDVAAAADPAFGLRRSEALREDLRCMDVSGQNIHALERCRRLPSIAPAGLRGYSYVVLGSMLGGKIIAERLRGVLGPGASLRFYGDGDGRCEARWAAFCSDLETNGKDDIAVICATAVAIFDAFGAWMAEPLARAGSR